MSTPNSLCASLVVYGSYAPGGVDHDKLSFLPGQWIEGGVNAAPTDPTANAKNCSMVQFGGADVLTTWMITFADKPDCNVWDEEFRVWSRLLWDRWQKIDAIFGPDMVRTSTRWWPKTDPKHYHSINVYKSVTRHAYAVHQHDAIHPDHESDILQLWKQTVSGEFKYEPHTFCGFINDLKPSDFEDIFGELPGSDGFIKRLRAVFGEQTEPGSDQPSVTADGKWRLYFSPTVPEHLSQEQMLDLARRDVAAKFLYVQQHASDRIADEADQIAGLSYKFTSVPEEHPYDDVGLRDVFSDLMIEAEPDHQWFDCLSESCFSIAASNELKRWLLQDWLDPKCNALEIGAILWKSRIRYHIENGVCFVYQD